MFWMNAAVRACFDKIFVAKNIVWQINCHDTSKKYFMLATFKLNLNIHKCDIKLNFNILKINFIFIITWITVGKINVSVIPIIIIINPN